MAKDRPHRKSRRFSRLSVALRRRGSDYPRFDYRRRQLTGVEPLEPRIVLDSSGFPGNECAPDLDLSAVAPQTLAAGETLSFDLYTAGATAIDLDGAGTPTGDTIRLLLDPDVPVETPIGASITEEGVFTWTPSLDQIGIHTIIVIAVDQGSPPLADAETFTIEVTDPNVGNQAPIVDLNGDDAGDGFEATFVEDGGAVSIVDVDLSVVDSDSVNLASATIEITNLADGDAESLAVDTTGTAIAAAYDSATGVMTLTGDDTVAAYQQVLRTLTYNNTSQAPIEGQRSIEVVVNDGTDDSSAAVATVNVEGVNDIPVVDLNGPDAGADFDATFTEGDGPVAIVGGDLTIADLDHATIASATVRITNFLDGIFEILSVDTSGTAITATYYDATGELTLTGSDTLAAYEQVLRTLTYDNTSLGPDPTDRLIEVVVNDGVDDSLVRTSTVSLVTKNDPPDLAAIPDQEGNVDEELVVFVTATDPDPGDILTFMLDPDNLPLGAVIVQTSNTTAEVRWTPATTDQAAPVSFIVLVTDDGTPALSDSEAYLVTVLDPRPTLDLNGPDPGTGIAATFTEDEGPVAIAEDDVVITTFSSPTIVSATITITNLQDGDAEILDADDMQSATVIVTYADGVLMLVGIDTPTNYEQFLGSLLYNNTSQDPTVGDRIIEVVLNDGVNDSLPAIATVSVVAINDFPDLTLPAPFDDPPTPFDVPIGQAVMFTAQVVDVDHAADELAFLVDIDGSGLPDGAAEPTITTPGGVFEWTPDTTGLYTFAVLVIDADGGADQQKVIFNVVGGGTSVKSLLDSAAEIDATAPRGQATEKQDNSFARDLFFGTSGQGPIVWDSPRPFASGASVANTFRANSVTLDFSSNSKSIVTVSARDSAVADEWGDETEGGLDVGFRRISSDPKTAVNEGVKESGHLLGSKERA